MSTTKSLLKRATAYVLAFVMAFSLLFTGNSAITANAAAKVTSIKVAKSKVTLEAGKTANIKVTVKGGNKKFTVKSTKKSVATAKVVGKKVRITAKSAGTATVKVTTKGKNKKGKKLTKKIKVTVTAAATPTPAPTPVPTNPADKYNNVKITTPTTADGSTPSVNVGTSTKLTANVDPADAASVVWTSSNPAVAVVSSDGTVTGVANGTVDAIATMNGKEIGRISISITLVAVTGVSLNQKTLELSEGSKGTLTATVTPSNATNRNVTWSSSDENYATVDANGVVTARKSGKATITVTTVDKSFTDTCEVTVVAETNKDTDTIEAKVSNSLKDYENTVLVGTDARIDFDVIKNGAQKDDRVHVDLDEVAGYTDLYDVDVTDVTTENGHGYFYVRFDKKNNYSPRKVATPIASSAADYAFASFSITLTAGGAGVHTKEPIKLSFAQVVPDSNGFYSNVAVSADATDDSVLAQTGSLRSKENEVYNEDGYREEYLVDQQVTEPSFDAYHEVEFDAAPLLLLPATISGTEKGTWTTPVSFEFKDYGTYCNEEQGYTIAGVPGGLEYATLLFNYFQISQYTQFIVRAYYADTEIPIRDNFGQLIQKEVAYDETVIETNSSNNTIQIGDEVFNDTTNDIRTIDLKVFVQSEGQVNNTTNKGFKLTGIRGRYKNVDVQPFDTVRLKEAVQWQLGGDPEYRYAGFGKLSNPESYLGNYYSSGSTYEYTTPTYPYIGNAIIRETSTSGVIRYYLYPSVVVNKQNVLKTPANSAYTFLATDEQVVELTSSKYTKDITTENILKIDTRYAGYLPVKATIQYGEKDSKGKYAIDYDVYSFVQWSPIPASERIVPIDYYALAGQKITLKAYVHDGVNKASDVPVTWRGIADNSGYTITSTTTTNTFGIATLELISNSAIDISNVYAVAEGFNVDLSVDTTGGDASVKGNKKVATGHAALHWVKPGIYYKNSFDGRDYNTALSDNTVKAESSSFKINEPWTIGTKVVGQMAYNPTQSVIDISNVKIDLSGITTGGANSEVSSTGKNGEGKVVSSGTGTVTITAKLNGYIDGNPNNCVLTILDTSGDEEIIRHETSVGTGTYAAGANLEINHVWGNKGAKLSIVNVNKNFDIANGVNPHVYVKVVDDGGNAYPGLPVAYTVTDTAGTQIDANTGTTNGSGLVDIEIDMEDVNGVGDYKIVAYLAENESIKADTTISFKNNNLQFNLAGDPAKDYDNKQITLTFNRAVDPETLIKEFFTVTSNGNENVIRAVEVVSDNNAKVIITLQDAIAADTTVQINNTYDSGTRVYYLLDQTGILYNNNN